jgi:hypothetical protein
VKLQNEFAAKKLMSPTSNVQSEQQPVYFFRRFVDAHFWVVGYMV